MSTPAWTPRQRWVAIAQGMQQDVSGYGALHGLLKQQFHAALRHDAAQMEALATAITTQAQQLENNRSTRVQHVQALLPPGSKVSMQAVFALLQPPLQTQLQALWAQLEAQVVACKNQNLRNCQLIMEQAEIMRSVIMGAAAAPAIYAPI